ncbi:MAG: GldG family protein [Treponema sp.]|jgi:hypothetical protein|nr:GldG family protein [Treponema sp.]
MKRDKTVHGGIRKLRRRGLSWAAIAAAALVLIALNTAATLAARRFSFLRPDLTKSRIFRPDPAVLQSLKKLEKDVTVYVLAREETFTETSVYNAQANELIREFERNVPALSVVYVDYVRDPSFASRYPDLVMKHGDLLVECGEKYVLVKTEELFNYAPGASGALAIASSRVEEAIHSAIRSVSSGRPLQVELVSGHGEYTMTDFFVLLGKNNYELSTLNLATSDPAPGTDMLFVIAPKSDLSEAELEKIDRFLIAGETYGKTLLYSADPGQGPLPALETFLREWGAAVEDGAVFETDEKRVYNYHPFYAVADYAEETYAGPLAETGRPMLMPVARPLEAVFEYRGNYSARPLLSFAASTGVRPSSAPADFTAASALVRGPLPAMLLCAYSLRDRGSGKIAAASYLVVSGSTAMMDGFAVNDPSFANAEYLVKLLNKLSAREEPLAFRSRTLAGGGLNLSKNTVNTLGAFLIFVIPLLVLASGLAVWIRRIRS